MVRSTKIHKDLQRVGRQPHAVELATAQTRRAAPLHDTTPAVHFELAVGDHSLELGHELGSYRRLETKRAAFGAHLLWLVVQDCVVPAAGGVRGVLEAAHIGVQLDVVLN